MTSQHGTSSEELAAARRCGAHRPGDGNVCRGSASVVNPSGGDCIFNMWKHVHNSGHKGGGVKKPRPSSIGALERNLGLHAIRDVKAHGGSAAKIAYTDFLIEFSSMCPFNCS